MNKKIKENKKMFNNSNQRKPKRFNANEQSSFIGELFNMINDDFIVNQTQFNAITKENYSVKTDEFTQQVQLILSDIFVRTATIEENNVINMQFPSGELFKLRIVKQ